MGIHIAKELAEENIKTKIHLSEDRWMIGAVNGT